MIAHHEAGHAVVARHEAVPFTLVSIIPGQDFRGFLKASKRWMNLLHCAAYDNSSAARLRVERYARVALAGRLAQRRFRPRSAWRAVADKDNQYAFRLLSKVINHVGDEVTKVFQWGSAA